jgi:hypothetical protein
VVSVGSHTGHVVFPACANTDLRPQLAVGHSNAVAVYAGCGKVYARSISTTAKVGKLIRLGASPVSATGSAGQATVSVVADRSGHFTAAYVVPGGDLQVAHSSNGAHWTTNARRSVPISNGLTYGINGRVSSGAATWYATTTSVPGNSFAYRVAAIPLSATYRPPASLSGKGVAHPRHGHLGSLAVVVPGTVSLASIHKNGRIRIKLVDALQTSIAVSVSVTQTSKTTTFYICSAASTVALKARHARTIIETCTNGGVIVTQPDVSRPSTVKKNDAVVFTFGGRSGTLTMNSKVT